MQFSYFKCLYLTVFMFFYYNQKQYAQNKPNPSKLNTSETVISLQDIEQKKILLQTNNPVAIYNVEEIAEIGITYNTKENKYTNYNQPKEINSLVFSAEGYTKPKVVSFYGKIKYHNIKEKRLKWNNTSFITPNNPFVFADSINSDYDNEFFFLQGKIASKLKNTRFIWGANVDYKVGNKVNQNDPRSEIQSQRIALRPGVLYSINKWNFGFNLYYEKFKEEIDVTVVEYNINHYYFKFLGFGVFFKGSGNSFSRNYNGNNYGLSFQALYNNDESVKSIFEIKYINKYERAEDGSDKIRFLAGDYKNSVFSFYNNWIINSSNLSNQILLKASIENVKGIWFDQKQTLASDKTLYWEVYNKSIRYKLFALDTKIAYIFAKPSYSIKANVLLSYVKSNFYPNEFLEKYHNIIPNITYEKMWFLTKNKLHISTSLGYKLNLKKAILIDKKLELSDSIIYPEYYYKTADVLYFNNEFKIGFSAIFKNKLCPYLSFKGGVAYAKSESELYNKKTQYNGSVKLSIIF